MPVVMATAPAAANPDDPPASREDAPGSDTPAGPEILRGHIWTPRGMQVVETVDEVTGCLASDDARVWIDVESATEETLTQLAEIARPPQARREGHRRAAPAGQDHDVGITGSTSSCSRYPTMAS